MPLNTAKAAVRSPKSRVNLTLRADLVKEAKRSGVNLSQLAEDALEQRLREARAQRWRDENKEAIEAFGHYIEKYGVFGDTAERGF